MPLRSGLIRLAYENPELRPVLLPLLTKQAAKKGDLLKVVKAMRFHPGDRRKTITLPVGATVELIDDNVGGGAWAVLFPAGLPKAEWDGHVFPIFKSDHGNFVPVEGKTAATDPKQVVKSVYKDHERDFKSLHARIVDMKKDSSFNSLKAKTDLNVVLESLDMLKKAGSVEDYAEHAQAIEAACGKVLAKSKTDGLDDLLPLVKDVQKGAKAVAAKAGE